MSVGANSSSSAALTSTHPAPPTHVNQSQHRSPEPDQSACRPQQSSQSGASAANASLARPDGDSIALDRTPTDDEINWLWQKVRTCLSTSRTNHASPPITNPTTSTNISSHSGANTNNPAHPNIANHTNPSASNPAGGSRAGNPSSSRTPGVSPGVSRTYIDGTCLSTHRAPTSSLYVNNYMGSSARRRLVTMDTLGRLVQRQLPRRPLSGVTVRQSPAGAGQSTRVSSAPASRDRTSAAGDCSLTTDLY